MTKNICNAIAFLTGLGLIFIGARFLIAPETGELGFGIHFQEQGDYSFHSIKGIRDLFSGLLLCMLIVSKQTKALALTLLVATIIPTADMLIVFSKEYNDIRQAIPHIAAIMVCLFCGIPLLIKGKKSIEKNSFVKIIQSLTDLHQESVIEYNIAPNEKTPWHYHTLFTESFEVLKGTLEVGLNREVVQLKEGQIVAIRPHEKHYFHNISKDDCVIKVVVSPGNKNFEKALIISKGLAKDGLASTTGVPKKISHLALFIYLNNSKMVGLQKMAEPFFNYLAKRAIKKGRLKDLELKYCGK